MRVYIEVTEAQHAQLKELAGLVPVSRWIRSQLFPVDDAQRAKDLIPLLKKSIEKSERLTKKGRHDDLSEIGKRNYEGEPSGEEPIYKDEEHPRGTPAPVDMRKFLP